MKLFKKGQKVLYVSERGIEKCKVISHTLEQLKVKHPLSTSIVSKHFFSYYVEDTSYNRKVALMYEESIRLSKKQLAHIEKLFI